MADIEVKLIADELGKDIEKIAPHVEQELHRAVENLANAAYSAIIARVQGMSMDPKNRKDYLRALKFRKVDDSSWMIFLDGSWPNQLEEGYGPYSIKDQLLKSEKTVAVGSRSGEPWVRTSSKGEKFAAVPFEHKPFSGEKMAGDLATDLEKILVKNRSGKEQSITKIFKDLGGKPISGKVASIKEVPGHPNLAGLTKYQQVSDSGKVSGIYMTYRTVSESSSGWQHPGHKGYQLFKEAENYVEQELKNIVKTLL